MNSIVLSVLSTKNEDVRIVEIGYIICKGNERTYKSKVVKPEGYEIKEVNGITYEYAMENGEKIEEILEDFLEDIKDIKKIVGYDVDKSMDIILSECERVNNKRLMEEIEKKYKFSIMKVGKLLMRKETKLEEIYMYLYGYESPLKKISAINRSIICYECYEKIDKIL